MNGFKKRIIIFLCVASILIGSLAVPIKSKAVVGTVVASYTLAEVLTYVISGVLAVGATIGLNEVLNNDEEMYTLVNHYLSESSGIVIDESKGTVVKDDQEVTIQEWIDNINNKYGAQMADQEGDDFLDQLNDISLRLQYSSDTMDIVEGRYLDNEAREQLDTDKLWVTEAEFQELLYALYLKNHGILDEAEEIAPSPSPDDDKHKLDWKTLAVTTASVPIAALGVGGKTFWENVSNFFYELLNDETEITNYPSLSSLYSFDTPYYDGTLDVDIDGNYYVNISGSYTYISDQTVKAKGICSHPIFAIISEDYSSISFRACNNPSSYPTGYTLKVSGIRNYNGLDHSFSNVSSLGATGATNGSWAVNVPMFIADDIEGIKAFVQNNDDSSCINREQPKFTYFHVLDNSGSLSNTLQSLNNIPNTKGLSSVTLYNYAQDILDNQDTLKSDPDEYNALILPKIDTLANSAGDVTFTIVSDNDSESGTGSDDETESKPTYGDDVSDNEDFEVVTNPDPISLPVILPFTIPSVAQKVKGTSDWEYNYSPFFIAIISMLMIDVETVKAHAMDSLDKLPPLNGTQAVFDSINIIVDSVNDEIIYPVISINTPEILYQFYPYSEIVLCDTADYERFFSFVRSALSVSLAVGFVMWLLRQLKITLSIN